MKYHLITLICFFFFGITSNNYSQSKNFDFKNASYSFEEGQTLKFNNGIWSDSDLGAQVDLKEIIKLTFIENKDAYLLYFSGNWGGGNWFYGEILIVSLETNKIKNLQEMTIASTESPPRVENNSIIINQFMWLDADTHCCPSYKIESKYDWNGGQFNEISSQKIKTKYYEDWKESK